MFKNDYQLKTLKFQKVISYITLMKVIEKLHYYILSRVTCNLCIYIYIYISQYQNQYSSLSPPSLSKYVLSWTIQFSYESTAFTSLPLRRLMW